MHATDVVGALLEHFRRGDLRAASSLLHPRVRVVVMGDHALAGLHVGRRAWREYAEALTRTGEGTYHVDEIDRLSGTNYCALVLEASVADGHGSLRRRTWRRLVTYHVVADRITEMWLADLDGDEAVPAHAVGATTMMDTTS